MLHHIIQRDGGSVFHIINKRLKKYDNKDTFKVVLILILKKR